MIDKKIVGEILEKIEREENESRTPKNLVEVRFEKGTPLTLTLANPTSIA